MNSFGVPKKELKEVQKKKNKIDTPILVDLVNMLKKTNISAAAYHGGKLNGIDCHELLSILKSSTICAQLSITAGVRRTK